MFVDKLQVGNNEKERLEALQSYQILNTGPDPLFDNLVKIAARIANCPIAAISLMDSDRQWFKAKVGVSIDSTERSLSFCHHMILSDCEFMEIPDLSQDARFKENTFVYGEASFRYYLGIPLISPNGYRIGGLCLISPEAKPGMSEEDLKTLQIIAHQVMAILEVRKSDREKEYVQKRLLESSRASLINEMTKGISHEINNPLTVIMASTELLAMKAGGMKDPKVENLVSKLKSNIQMIQKVVATVKEMSSAQAGDHYGTYAEVVDKTISLVEKKFEREQIKVLVKENNFSKSHLQIPLSAQQVLFHMLQNASFAANKGKQPPSVALEVAVRGEYMICQIKDSGIGVPEDKIPNLFGILFHSNYKGEAIGIGLSTCKSIMDSLGGSIRFVQNGPTTFEIAIPVKLTA